MVDSYVNSWKSRGYSDDIPDEVPDDLMRLGLAPSYKAIALSILRNDVGLRSLGFSCPKSEWYSAYKRIEIEGRRKND